MKNIWIFFLFPLLLNATPGAVAEPELWLNSSNAGANGTAVATWSDLSGNGRDAIQNVGSKQPTVQENRANFNPVVHFTKDSGTFLDVENDVALNGKNLSVFIVTKFDGSNTHASAWTTREDTTGDHDTFGHILYVYNNKYEYWNGDGNSGWQTHATGVTVSSNYEIATTVSKRASNSSIDKYFYIQGKKKLGKTSIAFAENSTKPFRIGGGATEDTNGRYFWNGDIAEVIVYAKRVSLDERKRVETYLALKYGITLIQDKVYKDSGGTNFWTAGNNGGYKNDIAGLGRDDASPLRQSISKSINSDAIITMATGGDFISKNDDSRSALGDDRSFLVWSNNDELGTWSSTDAPANGKILKRVWKVQKTGTQNSVSLQVDVNDPEFDMDDFNGKLFLVKGDDLSTATPIPMTQNGSLWSIEGVEFADGDLFSFVSDLPLPDIKLKKSSTTIYDPINEESNPKAIPGALVKYTIHAQNEGLGKTDNDTVAIADAVPENMKMCVDNIDRCLKAEFVDGTVSSELTLGTVDYSDNGGTDFNYTPIADAEGYDVSVTNVQIKLNGSFKESDGTNHPYFNIKLHMGVK